MPAFLIHGSILGLFIMAIWVMVSIAYTQTLDLDWKKVFVFFLILQVICISGSYLFAVGIF